MNITSSLTNVMKKRVPKLGKSRMGDIKAYPGPIKLHGDKTLGTIPHSTVSKNK